MPGLCLWSRINLVPFLFENVGNFSLSLKILNWRLLCLVMEPIKEFLSRQSPCIILNITLKAAGGGYPFRVPRMLTQIYPEIITGKPQLRHHYYKDSAQNNSMIVPGGDATTVHKMLGSSKSISCLWVRQRLNPMSPEIAVNVGRSTVAKWFAVCLAAVRSIFLNMPSTKHPS